MNQSGTATLTGCTISNNSAPGTYGFPPSGGYGGGLNNAGTVTLTNCTVSGNSASGNPWSGNGGGGGLFNSGTAQLIGSTISGNTSLASGGGVLNYRARSR